MSQRTAGPWKILGVPLVYDAFQRLLGADRARRRFVEDYLSIEPGSTVLDVGCGTGELLDHLPDGIHYIGFDLSDDYIDRARSLRGSRGRFVRADVRDFESLDVPPVDVATCVGILHHLDDDSAANILAAVARRLRPGGRLVTIDPAYTDDQSWLARQVISRDRGECVRHPERMATLFPREMVTRTAVRHDLLRIPYTHVVVVAIRPDANEQAAA